jgi:hypothetical protein
LEFVFASNDVDKIANVITWKLENSFGAESRAPLKIDRRADIEEAVRIDIEQGCKATERVGAGLAPRVPEFPAADLLNALVDDASNYVESKALRCSSLRTKL